MVSRISTLSEMVLLSALALQASTIDPRGAVLNGSNSSGVPAMFDVTVNGFGGGVFDLQNTTGDLWIGLILNAQFGVDASSVPFNCDPGTGNFSAFQNCNSAFNPDTHVLTVTYSGVLPPEDEPTPGEIEDDPEGIPAGGHFIIDLNDLAGGTDVTTCSTESFSPTCSGVGGWVPNSTLTFTAVTAPEPQMTVLLVIALGGMLLAHRRFRRLN